VQQYLVEQSPLLAALQLSAFAPEKRLLSSGVLLVDAIRENQKKLKHNKLSQDLPSKK
jgi:hypothetical protein